MCSIENDRLADEITELASHIHAATCRWLGLVAEFERRGGWSEWGCRSCAHWLSWRCGIGPVAAREHVRVGLRLEELPMIRGAFAEGRLSYSQVRALCATGSVSLDQRVANVVLVTRVDNVVHEEELLSLARHATAAQLERLVRAHRGVVARARTAESGGPERWVRWDHADDGSLLLHARLPAEEGAVVLAALEAGVERLREPASAESPSLVPASAEAPALEPASAEAPALEPASAEPPALVDAASAGAPAVDSAAAIESASAQAPVAESALAEEPSLAERRTDALVLMADTLLAGEPNGRGGDRYQVVVHVDAAELRDGNGDGELADGTPIAPDTVRRLACDASIVPLIERAGRPLSVGRKTRSIPPALRRALESRDRGCRFPGCTNARTVDAHHVEHWADGGATSLDNLVQLWRHHHRLIHEGGYTVTTRGAGFVFRRPDGREIRPAPRRTRGCSRELRDGNDRSGHTIDAQATVTLWAGERFSLADNVDALLTFAPPEAPGI